MLNRRLIRVKVFKLLFGKAMQGDQPLEQAEKELCGSAATDYVRASELDTRIREIEDRLLEIYEELEA